jgi:hypothetical protein
MPKQPTFKKTYPTLRNPFKLSQNSGSHITLRERTNILQPVSALISSLPPVIPIINNNDNKNPIKNRQKIITSNRTDDTFKSTSANLIRHSIDTDTLANYESYFPNDQENVFLNTSEAALQYINDEDLILEDFSLMAPRSSTSRSTSRSTSPTSLLMEQNSQMPNDNNENSDNYENSDDNDENSDNNNENSDDDDENSDDDDENSDDDHTNYYDTNTELPGYTGDSGPYFPSVTAMWIFIWATKNMIGILLFI